MYICIIIIIVIENTQLKTTQAAFCEIHAPPLVAVYGRAWNLCKESAVIVDQELEICNSIYPIHKIELSDPKPGHRRLRPYKTPSPAFNTYGHTSFQTGRCAPL